MTPETYAASVVQILRGHFPDLTDPVVATFVADLIEDQARDPKSSFEVIVDDPISAKWRLHADSRDRSRVLLHVHRPITGPADVELSQTINDALRALET